MNVSFKHFCQYIAGVSAVLTHLSAGVNVKVLVNRENHLAHLASRLCFIINTIKSIVTRCLVYLLGVRKLLPGPLGADKNISGSSWNRSKSKTIKPASFPTTAAHDP